MRKIWILAVMLLLVVTVARAHEDTQPAPIIAYVEQKLYGVSADNGEATLLAEPTRSTEWLLIPNASNISPDAKQLVYISQSTFDTPLEDYGSGMFLINLEDGTRETITPKGGIFDVPAPKGQVFELSLPTWSADGQRIYYFRRQLDLSGTHAYVRVQLAYYDVAARKHVLAARVDEHKLLENLQAAEDGVVATWYEPGFNSNTTLTLYGHDNQIVHQFDQNGVYYYPVIHEGRAHYAIQDDLGSITSLLDLKTGQSQPIGVGYYPAAVSQGHVDQSMRVSYFISSTSWYGIYGADNPRTIGTIDDLEGVRFAIAPDGQSVAYLKYQGGSKAPIQIINAEGKVRELPFAAEQIIWGAVDHVAFPLPG